MKSLAGGGRAGDLMMKNGDCVANGMCGIYAYNSKMENCELGKVTYVLRYGASSLLKNVIAFPGLPARPVRPIR